MYDVDHIKSNAATASCGEPQHNFAVEHEYP
jgi:hypothetical protein